MQAGLSVAVDKDGRDWCVVVIKGTFAIGNNGKTKLAEEQESLVYADVHYGDPGTTSIKYECDFAPFKPRADVIVNGHAYSTKGRPAIEVSVALRIGNLFQKQIKVIGDRYWNIASVDLRPTPPIPFVRMPMVFERAFGGSDHSHTNPKYQGTEMRNPVGTGFHKNPDIKTLEGKRLPNLEHPRHPFRRWTDTPLPACFGILGRGWQPRIKLAGIYDKKWLDERFPFLPLDFEEEYFQSTPMDQQVPYFKGGEVIRCSNMTPEGTLVFKVPQLEISILYRFHNQDVKIEANLDTMLIEPDKRRLMLSWRTKVPTGRKFNSLREVLIGV